MFLLLLFGSGFYSFCKKKFITNNLQGFFFLICWTIRNILGAEAPMTLQGVPQCLPPDWEQCYGLCWFVRPTMGQMMAWHIVSGCSKWLVIQGWQIAATLSWVCGSAASPLFTRLLGKERSQPVSPHLPLAELRNHSSSFQQWYSSRFVALSVTQKCFKKG